MPTILGRLAALLILALSPAMGIANETLYNGIELPTPWPPRLSVLPDSLPTPPYLVSPPKVIPIDLGRQLFIDDFLIEETTLSRRFHRPTYHPANPVLAPDKEWEQAQGAPMAMPYSGGVWFDPADEKFKAWYMGGYNQHLCYAESKDGVAWNKPALDVVKGTNIVLPNGATESNTFWLDLNENDPKRRCKFFTERGGAIGNLVYRASPDGIHDWTGELWESGRCGDRTTVFFNPFRDKWVINIRESYSPGQRGRAKRYLELANINDPSSVAWPTQDQVPLWVTADRPFDAPNVEIGFAPQLYHLDCIAYESVMLGLFSILRGYFHADSSEGRLVHAGRPKHNDICLGFSRDGFHWHRPDHLPALPLSERKGDWNWGNVQSVGGGVLVVGDYLYLYCTGRAGEAAGEGNPLRFDADGATGLAVLRRDGFASMEAGASGGSLTTRRLRFGGKRLFVNANTAGGELRVEVLDARGKVIAPFSKENCEPIKGNQTIRPVAWKGATDLSGVAGKEVRFRFSLKNGGLYAFWVSPDASGASQGFVGAGGPGFTSHRDTAGLAAFAGNRKPLVDAGTDQTVRDENGQGMVPVALDSRGSVDHDGRIETFEWREDGKPIATGRQTTVNLLVGTHHLALAATDSGGSAGYDSVRIEVLPREDPAPMRHRLALWLKADALAGVKDGEAIRVWPDSAGNRLDPFQDDPAKRPIWNENAVNCLPAVRFDGDNDNLRTCYYRDLLFTSSKVSVVVVFRALGTIGSRGLVSSDWDALGTTSERSGSLAYSTAYQPPEGQFVWKNVFASGAGRVRPGEWMCGAVIRSGDQAGETRLYVDGVRDDDETPVPYHAMNTERGFIGCLRGETGCWKGDVAEILIYGDALSDTDRRSVEQYLSEKYRLN